MVKKRILVISSANIDFVQRMRRVPYSGETVTEMDNGYSYGTDLSSFIWYQATTYTVAESRSGEVPILKADKNYNLFYTVYKPLNNSKTRNRGIEYEIDLGRFDEIRTSFYINGAWTRYSSTDKGYSFSERSKASTPERNIDRKSVV